MKITNCPNIAFHLKVHVQFAKNEVSSVGANLYSSFEQAKPMYTTRARLSKGRNVAHHSLKSFPISLTKLPFYFRYLINEHPFNL